MKKKLFIFHPVFIFVLAQIAWASLLGLWIFWYVSNSKIFQQANETLQGVESSRFKTWLFGLFLLGFILIGTILIFLYLTRQLNLTKLYDNFIANITHELKSPLASIQLHLETLNYREMTKEHQQQFISYMMEDANRLQNLINSILEISALEQKKIAHDFQIYEATPLLRTILEDARQHCKLTARNLKIVGQPSFRVVVDQNALKIVFDNLFDNSIKYCLDEPIIMVTLSEHNNRLEILFQDSGIGISGKNIKQVFRKFHRIQHAAVPNVKGTGLGLYWAREIIKYHGGRISVHSKGPGHGTTFRIELPIYHGDKNRFLKKLLKIARKEKQNQVNKND